MHLNVCNSVFVIFFLFAHHFNNLRLQFFPHFILLNDFLLFYLGSYF